MMVNEFIVKKQFLVAFGLQRNTAPKKKDSENELFSGLITQNF
jgi:hypothetical protein